MQIFLIAPINYAISNLILFFDSKLCLFPIFVFIFYFLIVSIDLSLNCFEMPVLNLLFFKKYLFEHLPIFYSFNSEELEIMFSA